jgi:hypothetical protein
MKISILILAASSHDTEVSTSNYPSCLTEFNGLSLLERIVNNTRNVASAEYAFAFLKNEAERYHLDKIARLLCKGAHVFRIPESTKGSACTALLAASQLDPNSELLIVSANELVDVDLGEVVSDFRSRELDAGGLIFRSVHPRYSYVRLNKDGLVTQATQQDPISQNATAGVFWFSHTGNFLEATMNSIRKNAIVNGKFYVAPTFNELVLKQARIGVRNIDLSKYTPLKNDRQIQNFENGTKV